MNDDLSELDPETQRELDDAWDHLDDGDLEAAWKALTGLQEAAADIPEVLELQEKILETIVNRIKARRFLCNEAEPDPKQDSGWWCEIL